MTWLADRHVRVPWEALRFVLQRIADLKGNKTAYKELEKRGENLLDLVPGGAVQRALQAIERYAAGRVGDVLRLSKPMGHVPPLTPPPPLLVSHRFSICPCQHVNALLEQSKEVFYIKRVRVASPGAHYVICETPLFVQSDLVQK
jgi:hypothetical protein